MITCSVGGGLTSCNQRNFAEKTSPEQEENEFNAFLDSLDRLNVSTFEKSNEIRKYLARRLNRRKPVNTISHYFSRLPYDSLQPFECLSLLRSGELGGTCGLGSFILGKLYRYAGCTAYIYDCGYNSEFTHQFLLVAADQKLIVQDAHYNITIVNSRGEPKDFMDILSEIAAGDFSDIRVAGDEVIKKGKRTSFEKIAKQRLPHIKPLLHKEGLPENFLSIYLKPLYIMNSTTGKEEEELTNLIRAAVNRQDQPPS